ncbi:hypothetical protein KEM56_003182, partial [Ascosphaera pollenicola]
MSWDAGAAAGEWGDTAAAAPTPAPALAGGDSGWNGGADGGAADGAAHWSGSGDARNHDHEFGGANGGNGGGEFGGGGDGDFEGGDPAREPRDPGDDKCRNCDQPGHYARDCPEPKKMGACFNCGEEGHNKAECTKPRVFRGTCRICEKEGHPASECPDRPPDICKNCRQEGHKTLDCTANRVFDLTTIPDKMPEEAWEMMRKASAEREMDDFRDAFKIYSKACPTQTLPEIEQKMREAKFKVHLIALEKLESDVHVLVNLQGRLGCKYVVGFYFSEKPHRANLKDRWPESPEANLERLADAGFPMDRQVPKCGNCNELGHIAKHCKQERAAIERVEIKCVNCHQGGHRVRDCPEARVDRFACRNCQQPGHNAKECPEPRSADNVECRVCNQTGHFAKDCPDKPARDDGGCRNCGQEGHMARDCDQPRNMATVTCRNCDAAGHFSRDCPEPKDWSKVQCNTCGEMGHTVRRCPKAQEEESGDKGFGEGDAPVYDGFGK